MQPNWTFEKVCAGIRAAPTTRLGRSAALAQLGLVGSYYERVVGMRVADVAAGLIGGAISFAVTATIFGMLFAALTGIFIGLSTLLLTNALRMTRGVQ